MVLSVLSGMPYMEHLQENIETYSPLEPLTQDDMDFLDSTAQKFVRYPLIPCNDCKYCMPCPYGIDIPGILLLFNKCINEDRMPVSSMEGASTVAVCAASVESAKLHKPVQISYPKI